MAPNVESTEGVAQFSSQEYSGFLTFRSLRLERNGVGSRTGPARGLLGQWDKGRLRWCGVGGSEKVGSGRTDSGSNPNSYKLRNLK